MLLQRMWLYVFPVAYLSALAAYKCPPPTLQNGLLVGQGPLYTSTCNPGFELVGQSNVTCLSDSTATDLPSCKRKKFTFAISAPSCGCSPLRSEFSAHWNQDRSNESVHCTSGGRYTAARCLARIVSLDEANCLKSEKTPDPPGPTGFESWWVGRFFFSFQAVHFSDWSFEFFSSPNPFKKFLFLIGISQQTISR